MTDGPPRNRPRTPPGIARLTTEVAVLSAAVDTLTRSQTALSKTSGETRDSVLKMAAVLDSENLSARIEATREEARHGDEILRTDFSAALSPLRREDNEIKDRVKALEDNWNAFHGARRLGAWLTATGIGALAAIGVLIAAAAAWIAGQHH